MAEKNSSGDDTLGTQEPGEGSSDLGKEAAPHAQDQTLEPSGNTHGGGLKGVLGSAWHEISDPFVALAKAPRALWGVNLAYLLEGLVYFGVLTLLGKYLSEDVGLSDLHTGWVMSVMTAGITLSMLFLGGLGDKLGVRKALLFSLAVLVAGRVVLALSSGLPASGLWSPAFFTVIIALLIVIVGYGMFQPSAYAGVKQFTDEKTKAISYAMLYGLMNLGSFVSGVVSPPLRQSTGIGGVFILYAIITALALVVVFVVLSKKTVLRDTLTQTEADKPEPGTAVPKQERAISFGFVVYVFLALLALAGLLAARQLKDKPVAQLALQDAGKVFDDSISAVNPAKGQIPEKPRSESLKDAAVAVDGVKARVMAPALLEPGVVVDNSVYDFIREILTSESAALNSVADLPAATLDSAISGSADQVKQERVRLRAAGVLLLAVAYDMSEAVTPEVIQTLRVRNKRPGEGEPVALDSGLEKAMPELLSGSIADKLTNAGRYLEVLADDMKASPVDGLRVLGPLLRADAGQLKAGAGLLAANIDSVVLRAAVQDRVLDMSEYYLKLLPELLGEQEAGPDSEGGEVEAITGTRLVADRLGLQSAKIESLSGAVDSAQIVPWDVRLMNWGMDWGVYAIGILVFAWLAIRRLLKRRPDHPFNNGPFVFFIFILIPVQTLFAHNWLTLPLYIDRAFGGTWVGEHFEFFANLNPILIFFLSPIVAALTVKSNVYKMMIIGTLVMASPTFLLAIGPNPGLLLLFTLIVSIGEAMWQPRFLQWVADVAPKGKTGMYMGIAQFPWFLTKVVTGLYSGYFLANYCPRIGPQNTQMLWLIYGFIAMVTPVSLALARRWADRTTSSDKLSNS